MRIAFCLSVLLVGFSSAVFAQKAAVTLGLSQVQVQGDTGVDVSSNGSYQLGALFYHPFSDMMEARLGALLGQENLTFTQSGNDVELNLTSINVPLTLGFRFAERFLMFLGPVINVNVTKTCKASVGSCSVSSFKAKGTDVLLSFGGHVQLTESLGLEISLDKMSGKPFVGTTGGQIINVNFQYIIE
jgi:hypothetical protein